MAKLRNVCVYAKASLEALKQRPSFSTLAFAVTYASECLRLFESGQPDFLAQARPWMCFPANELLARVLKPDSKVFEFGSGGSTLYFAGAVREVVSVEHDPGWYQRVRAELDARKVYNVHYKLVMPIANSSSERNRSSDPRAYVSDDEKYAGHSFEAYAQAIDSYPNLHFDLVVVDGRARPSCLMHAAQKVAVGGILLLDQSERSYYLAEISALHDTDRWSAVRFMAPLPYSLHFTEATFFTKMRL